MIILPRHRLQCDAPAWARAERIGSGCRWLGVWLVLLVCVSAAQADGGAVRRSERVGGCQVTVMTAPVPFRAGPVDVSVLVQDAATGAPRLDSRVNVVARPLDRHGPEIIARATAEQATNRLLQSAHFELPSPGRWQLEVVVEDVDGPVRTTLEVEAAEPLPRWRDLLFWLTLPAWPILLFGLHEVLRYRQRNRPRRS